MVFNLVRTRKQEFLFFSILSIGYASAFGITAFQHELSNYIRYILFASAVVVFFAPIFKSDEPAQQKLESFKFLILYLFFVLYGLVWSFLWGGSKLFAESQNSVPFLLLSIVYGFLMFGVVSSLYRDSQKWALGIPVLSLYLVISVLGDLMLGGISLSQLELKFETVEGDAAYYSQGFTKVCAVAGVYFLAIATNTSKREIGLYALAIAFLGLCILGGSRGDIMAGFFALALFLIRRPNALNVTLFASSTLFLFIFVIQSGIWAQFTVFNRFLEFTEGNFSKRDVLFSQAIQLIGESKCSLFGCGFNFFQLSNNYEFGLYPHNIFLESIITFGVLMGGAAVALCAYGAIILYLKVGKNPIFYIFLVDLFSFQKSGSILDYTSLPTLLCFAWFGWQAMLSRRAQVGARDTTRRSR